ncbi:hypothetical protein FGKAn22_15700 [Ferrigenium kumadai]|uniref:Uncharacterized protein n=1 Tax=Ferrigenium kumadai TaxID=1682490 RepID=A0AAN1SZX0_9PROT|nr:hypothetical protein [Ferrigenium kumadai]BBI99877.1 hypothetical protein FGKAn22_15700 [Ferrigenium kumadai]
MIVPALPTKKPSVVLTKPPALATLLALDENKNTGKDIRRTRAEIAAATEQNAIPKITAGLFAMPPALNSNTVGEGFDGSTDAGSRPSCSEETEALGAITILGLSELKKYREKPANRNPATRSATNHRGITAL